MQTHDSGDQEASLPSTTPCYVGYMRPSSFLGTPEQLEALASAYVGFQWVFTWNAVLTVGLWFVLGMTGGKFGDFDLVLLASFVIIAVCTTLMSIRASRRYAYGFGRPPSSGIATAIALGPLSWIFFGIFGYSSVMRRTINEIKRYGIRPRFWGISRADVAIRAAEMRAHPTSPPPTVPSANT